MVYYAIAPEYTELVDPLNESSMIPIRRAPTYWSNGTEMNLLPIRFAVPVGNWSLFSEIVMSRSDDNNGYNIIDTIDVWGYEAEYQAGIDQVYHSMEYSKNDGVLVRLVFEFTILSTTHLTIVERVGLGPSILQIGITLVAAIAVVVVLVMYNRYKKKNEISLNKKRW